MRARPTTPTTLPLWIRGLVLGLMLAGAAPAFAWQQDLTKLGVGRHWTKPVVTWRAVDPLPGADGGRAVLENVFAIWSAPACAHLEFAEAAPGAPADIEIRHPLGHWPHAVDDTGHTNLEANAESGAIQRAFITLNAGAIASEKMDVQSILLHEIGHAIGIGHSAGDPRSVMYTTGRPGAQVRPGLGPDDVAAVCAIYPRTAASASPSPAQPGGDGEGSWTARLEHLFANPATRRVIAIGLAVVFAALVVARVVLTVRRRRQARPKTD